MRLPGAFASLPHDVRLLMGARLARSLGQGALVVDFALYLHALGWQAASIGALLTGGLAVGSVLTMVVGPLSDRIGRRRLLIVYEWLQFAGALGAALTADPWVLVPAALLGSFGRGGNGSAGPFGAVEQAWLARGVAAERRGQVFSLNASVGFAGMALGALAAALPGLLAPALGAPAAYRLLFLVVLAGSAACLLLLRRTHDAPAPAEAAAREEPARTAGDPPAAAGDDAALTRRENRLMLRLVVVNALNGFGVGLTGPLVAYWFALRFGAGPEALGPLMAVGFALGAGSSLGAGRLIGRLGLMRALVAMRVAAVVLLVLQPLAPVLWLAAGIYVLRSVCNRGTIGARQAITVSLVRTRRRGLAASVSTVSQQVPRAVGPTVAGVMFDAGLLVLPFLIGAGFQAAFIWLYERSFREVDPTRKAPPPIGTG